LFDQKQSPFLYKVPLSVHTIYDVDYENPDYEKFPALKYAKDMKFLWNMVMRFYSGSILAFQQIFGTWVFSFTEGSSQ
jgi:1-deoxy-D-xylulose 5-phosphate reductoisomerase